MTYFKHCLELAMFVISIAPICGISNAAVDHGVVQKHMESDRDKTGTTRGAEKNVDSQVINMTTLASRVSLGAERGGIRTPGSCYTTPVFKTGEAKPETVEAEQVTETANTGLPSGLPESLENDADFGCLVDAWPMLPAHLKQTILTLVKSIATVGE